MNNREIMSRILIEKIESLPPLPNSIIELEDFKKAGTSNPDELVAIIEKDPLMITTILRIANSTMFGFRSKVETLSRAINLLGVNFTISIAIGSIVQNTIKGNLLAYAVSNEDFINSCTLATKIINTWISSIDYDLKEDLLLPAFLQETGKFIISDMIQSRKLTEDFLKKLDETSNITECEREFTGYSCARVTANVFKHWSLSYNLIFAIGFVEEEDTCPPEYKQKAQILEIVKALADIRNPLSDDNIHKAIGLASKYDFDVDHLLNCIDAIKEEIAQNS